MVAALRNAGIRAELYLGNPKQMSATQLKYADKRGSPCVVIQGGDEKAKGEVQIKDLILGAELTGHQGPRRISEEAGRGAVRGVREAEALRRGKRRAECVLGAPRGRALELSDFASIRATRLRPLRAFLLLPGQLLHVENVDLAPAGHDDVARLLIGLAGAEPFGGDRHPALTARRHAGRCCTLALGGHLDRVGAREVAADDGVRGRRRRTDLADRIHHDGAADLLHVLLRARVVAHAAAHGIHQLVGFSVDAMLHGLRRQVAILEIHLQLPQARLAGRQVQSRGLTGGKHAKRSEGEMRAHEILLELGVYVRATRANIFGATGTPSRAGC